MYSSFSTMVITFLITILVILFIAEKENPWKMLINFFRQLLFDQRFLFLIILMLAVLWINKIELNLEKTLTFINWDFTPFIKSYEYSISPLVQRMENMPTTTLLSYVYVFLFPALVWASLVYYKYKRDDVAVKRTFFAFLLNYLIAIPFYLFVPVNETWYANPNVHLLITKVYPTFNIGFRQLSGLNNDFPSLHNSISWSIALVAVSLKKYKRFKNLLIVSASLVTLSTIYLGIHWLTDIIGGLILSLIVVKMAISLSVKEYNLPQLSFNVVRKKLSVAKQYLLDVTTNLFS